MLITKLHVDGHQFALASDTDVPALKHQIVDAIKSAADFVDFHTAGHGSVSILVTSRTTATLETVDVSDDDDPSDGSVPIAFGYDPLPDFN